MAEARDKKEVRLIYEVAMKVLVTCGTELAGSHIVERLVAKGCPGARPSPEDIWHRSPREH
jgi:hypothetical protein